MKTVLKTFKFDNKQITLMIDFLIGFDSKDYLNDLPIILMEDTELTYSVTGYSEDGNRTGVYPIESSSNEKITTEELILRLSNVGVKIELEELNKILIESMVTDDTFINIRSELENSLAKI